MLDTGCLHDGKVLNLGVKDGGGRLVEGGVYLRKESFSMAPHLNHGI